MKSIVVAIFRVWLNNVSTPLWSVKDALPRFLRRCGLPELKTATPVNTSKLTIHWMLVTILCVAAAGQNASSSHSQTGRGLGFVYEPAREIAVVGTVRDIVPWPASGSPAGMHLLVATDTGIIDVHIGSHLGGETKDALQRGQLVQVTGVSENVHGRQILLARQLVFQGRLVTIRNERGFLVRDPSTSPLLNAKKHVAKGGLR